MALSAHLLRVECRTTAALMLPRFTGSALRGAFLGSLRGLFCPSPGRECTPCPAANVCPLSRLVATADPTGARGEEAPRPYVLRPVQAASASLEPGQPFSFALTLIGDAVSAFPYILQGLQAMGEAGFGLRQRAPGTFAIERIVASNPYLAAEQTVYQQGRATVYAPALPVRQEHISAAAAFLPSDRITLALRSPLRLVNKGQLVRELSMEIVMRRLLRRLTDLTAAFAPQPFQADFGMLVQAAARVQCMAQRTQWIDLESVSGRSGRHTPIGGLVGRVSFAGELAPLLPYLGWLPVTGIGKDVTKGNGWIELHDGNASRG